MKSLRDQIIELEEPRPTDLDPESHDVYPDHGADSGSADGRVDDEKTLPADGREHYQEVVPSTLRKEDKVQLGSRYAGSAVSRQRLVDEEDDERDPFAPVDLGSDEDVFARRSGDHGTDGSNTGSDEDEVAESSEESIVENTGNVKPRGSGRNKDSPNVRENGIIKKAETNGHSETSKRMSEMGLDDDSQSSLEGDSDTEPPDVGMEDSQSGTTSGLSNSASEDAEDAEDTATNGDRTALKALLFSSDSAAVASSLSAAANADAKKGQAIKTQYRTYDRLIDARIKLQKGLSAVTSMTMPPDQLDVTEHKDAMRGAEAAALTLWNTIISVRHSIAEADSPTNDKEEKAKTKSRKRKRPSPADTSTPLSTLWSIGESISSNQLSHQRAILNKWSAKIRASNPSVAAETRPRQLGQDAASTNSITQVIDSYLASEADRLIQQSTTLPNPTTPANATLSPSSLSYYYDDTTFYHSLLRDLISSRAISATDGAASSTTTRKSHLMMPPLPAKPGTKPAVDTKASKGRKIRYTVHEKLENFMAAHNNSYHNDDDNAGEYGGGSGRSWASEAACADFFASLMGGYAAAVLRPEEEEEGSHARRQEDGGGQVREDGLAVAPGLKLF